MKAKCDECQREVELTGDGLLKRHNRSYTQAETIRGVEVLGLEECPGTALRPLNPGGGGVWEISGGHFESKRIKH